MTDRPKPLAAVERLRRFVTQAYTCKPPMADDAREVSLVDLDLLAGLIEEAWDFCRVVECRCKSGRECARCYVLRKIEDARRE